MKAKVFSLIGCHATAEDLAHEVFLKLLEHHSFFTDVREMDKFISRMAINKVRDVLRTKKGWQKVQLRLKNASTVSHFPAPDANLLLMERLHELETVLHRLPLRQKEVFLLTRISGLSRQELARKMGISENTVKEHLRCTSKALAI